MSEIFDVKKISSILKQLKETEKFSKFNLFKTVKKTLFSFGDPIKKLREKIYKDYKNALNGKLDFTKFVQESKTAIAQTIRLLTDKRIKDKTIHVRRRLDLLKELTDQFKKLSPQAQDLDNMNENIEKINEAIVNSGKYEDVKKIKGLVVYRQKIQHGINLSGVLDKVTQLKYELIVALEGKTIGNNANTKIRTIKDRKVYRVANAKMELPSWGKMLVKLGSMFISESAELANLDINICVYITFVGGLMPLAGKFLDLNNQLDEGLMNK
ncbi:MAG: hypothetical protein LBJ32_02765 [Oscillospiraceae bacterium]|jgi:hypothetical protein|nr:hypothetical protein [Oscillospiraceae bacterium]